MSIIVSNYQHCDEQQFKRSHVHFTHFFSVTKLDLVIQALLLDYIPAWEKNTHTPSVHLVFIQKSIFLNIFNTKYNK